MRSPLWGGRSYCPRFIRIVTACRKKTICTPGTARRLRLHLLSLQLAVPLRHSEGRCVLGFATFSRLLVYDGWQLREYAGYQSLFFCLLFFATGGKFLCLSWSGIYTTKCGWSFTFGDFVGERWRGVEEAVITDRGSPVEYATTMCLGRCDVSTIKLAMNIENGCGGRKLIMPWSASVVWGVPWNILGSTVMITETVVFIKIQCSLYCLSNVCQAVQLWCELGPSSLDGLQRHAATGEMLVRLCWWRCLAERISSQWECHGTT